MSKRIVPVVMLIAVAWAAAGAGSASPALIRGIYDEANTLYGNPDRTFPILGQLRTQAIRVNLYWGGEFGVANRRPATPTDPEDPAYDWGIYDRTVLYAAQYRIKVVFSIWGTPGWANRFRGLRYAPTRAIDLQRFATAAARRYSGRFVLDEDPVTKVERRVVLPRVDHWLAWNEPNNPAFLFPQYRLVRGKAVAWSPREYAKICNAVVNGVNAARISAQKVACGVTAPRGNNNPKTLRPSISPVAFIRGMKAAGARGFDAYAHHPYHERPSESPTKPPRTKNAVTLANINVLVREVTRRFGGKRIWVTEYGWETRPQDRVFGVSFATQARYLAQSFAIARRHPRIDMMLWFLLRDDRSRSGWQSGLMTSSGKKKPSFSAFQKLLRAR